MKGLQKIAMLVLGLAFFATSCQKENVGPDGTKPEAGTFKAYMTDSPGDFEALNIEILRVEAFIEGEGWVTLNSNARSVNVLSLTNGVQTELTAAAESEAKAGAYTKLRIVFGSNNHITISNQAALALSEITGNLVATFSLHFKGEREVVIEIDEKVNSRVGAAVLLDFNVAQSVHQYADSFVIDPILTVIEDARTGVRGHVEGAASAAVTLNNHSGSFSTYINAEGDFLLRGMEDGTYDLIVMPCGVVGQLQDPQPKEVNGVIVTEGEITSVGTISF
ncbi:MAG TPA: DUF4382 domain-containing protein [Bacteroidia bacterium]|nr:DUF4382 domain-containing protein [Bacteroidia bacterium]